MDEEFDNDYAENYFDNGEGDDMDDLGDGGGGAGDMGNEFSRLPVILDRRSQLKFCRGLRVITSPVIAAGRTLVVRKWTFTSLDATSSA